MRCFAVLGPSHSGKTTLVRRLSGLDDTPMKPVVEDALAVTKFTYLKDPWCALDIAGGPENLAHAGQALAASDAAIVCVPPDPEAAVLAAPYLRMVDEAGTPAILFINRMDEAKGRVRDIVSALQAYTKHAIVLRQVPMREGGVITGAVDLISERAWEYREGQHSALVKIPDQALDREQEARAELLESLSDFDDDLLEQLIEDQQPGTEEIFSLTGKVLAENRVMPAFVGAAEHANGVTRLMKALRHEAPGSDVTAARHEGEDAMAIGVHAAIRKHLGKSVLIRAFTDGIKHGAGLGGNTLGTLTDLDGKSTIDTLGAGELALAVKSDHLDAGKLLDADGQRDLPPYAHGHTPSFARVLVPESDRDDARLSTALAKIAEIDPGLSLSQDEGTGHAVVNLQGPLHLRHLMSNLSEEFGVSATDTPVSPSYRESIARPVSKHYRHRKQSGGAGQFADVQLEVKPQARGSGFTFDEVVKGGAVPRNYIPAVEHGARDALEQGPLGFPVIDVSVTLTDGKHHSVDSSDFAFRTAGKAGVKEALQEGGPVLLQPIDKVAFHVPSIFSGALVTLVSSLKGQVLGFDANPDAPGWDIFNALLPAAAHDDIDRSLGAATQGTAWYEAEFDHYEQLSGKDAEKISAGRLEATH